MLHRFFSKFMLSAGNLHFGDGWNVFIIKMILNKTMKSFPYIIKCYGNFCFAEKETIFFATLIQIVTTTQKE
mgnify:CR=1 FL=1